MPRPRPFDFDSWHNQVIQAVFDTVQKAAQKALSSAVEDAPVRDVFKHGSAYRRRGLRTRRLTLEEAHSEDSIRRVLKYRNADGDIVPLARAVPGVTKTRGRQVTDNPYLRRAATRRGNPNSFAPFRIRRGTGVSAKEAREIFEEARQKGFGRAQKLERQTEADTDVYGGRELTRNGQLRHRPARYKFGKKTGLHAKGEYERRGRKGTRSGERMSAIYTDASGVTTLGGRLRKEIKMVGPVRMGDAIQASIVSPTYYAMFQEFGTRHNRATPYLRPAILKLRTTYRTSMLGALGRFASKE